MIWSQIRACGTPADATGHRPAGWAARRTGPKAVPAAAAPAGKSHVVAAAEALGQPHASSTGLRHAGEGPIGRRERHRVMPAERARGFLPLTVPSVHGTGIPFPVEHLPELGPSLYRWMRVVVAGRQGFRLQPEDRAELAAVDAGVADESEQFYILLE